MYLKEITCSGFKSFADKTSILLDEKVTAIVGPNGSGKSNVVDAVKWVIGEQSVKNLRGTDSMTDIIFSGSKSRNPLNVASVSLTFDNSDNFLVTPYSEVVIKRRVYRSGESEYYLNNKKCRLKDITDLLIDSLSSKESFNIISQGEISKIISNSSYDRRLIIESAAGVLKYKKRKEEAIRKLERTESNIERVLDIVNELELQLDPLREESEKAKKYLAIKEKLEDMEIALLSTEIEELSYESKELNKRLENINNEILNINLKISTLDSSVILKKEELFKIKEDIKKGSELIIELIKKEEKINKEKTLFQERSKYDSKDIKIYNNVSILKEDLLKYNNQTELLSSDIETLERDLIENNKQISELEIDINANRNKKNKIISDLNEKQKDLYTLENKIEITKNNIENNVTVPSSVKSILNNPRISVHGTISSLIDSDDKYLKALEVSLMSSKNFVVVESSNIAKNCINYLKENNLGRATFFPLDVIKPKYVDLETVENVRKVAGFIGILSDLVNYDKIYSDIIKNQIGNIILVDDFETARRVGNLINNRYRVVTLEGDIIHTGGSISGGSLQVSKSIISMKNELIDYNRKIIEAKEEIRNLSNSINLYDNNLAKFDNNYVSLSKKTYEISELIKIKKETLKEIEYTKDEIQTELNTLDNVSMANISKQEEKLVSEYYSINLEKEKVIKENNILEKTKDKLEQELEEQEGLVRLNNSELNKLNKDLKDIEISLNKNNIKLDNYLHILSDEYSLTFERAKENYSLDIPVVEARKEVGYYKNQIREIGMVNTSSIAMYDSINERYQFLSSERNDLIGARETLLEIISEMDSVMISEFKDTFDKVRVEFKKVFKELFKGGEADLLLTNEDNMLETGVDILASPPGKTLKKISLLSGGEMTLTAISLIFAILNVKRVPFCIFDEIEAALDEANVYHFGNYLDNYKEKTQFLIITHKKKTMEYADTLYGITMQESGVSKLVGVKLANIN